MMIQTCLLLVLDKSIYTNNNKINVGVHMVKIYIGNKNGQAQVTIPKAIVKAKGFKHMQEVEWKIDNLGQLILIIKA